MLVISTGKGYWALYLWGMVVLIPLLIDFLFDKQLGIPLGRHILDTVGLARYLGILALMLPGIPMIALGLRGRQLSGIQRVIHYQERERLLPRRPAHTLYRINVFYWGVLASVLGIALIFGLS